MDKLEQQRRLKLSALYQSSGWQVLKAQIQELLECADAEINEKTSKAVNPTELMSVNASIEKRNAFVSVLSLEHEFAEELEENSPVMALTDDGKD